METPGHRYDPVGSTNEFDTNVEHDEHAYFKKLENEQELLSTSLQALTSHFAQVQFRLRQIISAPQEQKINLIENLDEFASRGIPELNSCDDTNECILSAIYQQRLNQFKLIKKLQKELRAASNFANEKEIDFQIENSEMVLNEETLDTTDMDLSRLKTQILNLDTFVTDLQYETINLKQMTTAMVGYRNCEKVYKIHNVNVQNMGLMCHSFRDGRSSILNDLSENYDFMSVHKHEKLLSTLQRDGKSQCEVRQGALTKSTTADTNAIKYLSPKVRHWGNIRAKLEIDVQNIISVLSIKPLQTYHSEQSKGTVVTLEKEITKIVRKELCGTLRELIEHGLHSIQYEMNILGCCSRRTSKRKRISSNSNKLKERHAWDIIIEYYNLNDGNQHYRKPYNTLNESFQLKHSPNASTKDQLLNAIGDIINIHVRFNASENAYFKAFVSYGLNLRKLPHWLCVIFRCADLVEANYSDESFVRQSEFTDALQCLDLLSNYTFNLPIDTLADRFKEVNRDLFN